MADFEPWFGPRRSFGYWAAGILILRIAEFQRKDVKANALELETYPADDWLAVEGVSEITAVEPDEAGGNVWSREQTEIFFGTTGRQSERQKACFEPDP